MPESSEPIRPSVALRDSELPSLPGAAPVAPETKRGRRIALGVVLVFAFAAAAWVASSLWVGVMLGTVMAFTAQPAYRKLVTRFKDKHRGLAAAMVTLASGFLALVLGAAALYVVARELLLVGNILQKKMATGSLVELVGPRAVHLLGKMHVDQAQVMARLQHSLSEASDRAASAAAMVLQTTSGAMLGLLIALIVQYYTLLEWPSIAVRLETILPLDPRHTRALMLEFRDVGRSALIGTVATAVIQGALAGVGYALAGVPQPVTWGLLTAIASLLPVLGTMLVWLPIAGYEVWGGNVAWGIFVFAWGLLIVSSLTDYVIRPRLVGKKGHAHPALMLLALLGGIEVMGLAGLIVAPIIMSLFLAVLRIYERDTRAARAAIATHDGH